MAVTVVNYVVRPDLGGKFVVLVPRSGDGDTVILFSDFSRDSQHAHIVRRWLAALKTDLTHLGMRVEGGGWWRYQPDSGLLRLYGDSAAYGKYDSRRLNGSLEPGSVFSEQHISFE